MTRLPRPPGWAVRRALRRYRRPLAALCAALAVWTTVRAVAPPAPPTAQLTVAARDLGVGTVLGLNDLATVPVPLAVRPDGATTPAAGSVLAAPMRRGEPFTDVRLAGTGRPLRPPGSVVVTVRTADPAAVLAVRPGDRVDILAGPAADGGVPMGAAAAEPPPDVTVARGLVVLAVPGARPAGGGYALGYGTDGTDSTDSSSGTSGTDVPPGADGVAGGLLGGDAGADAGSPPDTSGVLIVAADRAAASRLAMAAGRSLSVAIIST